MVCRSTSLHVTVMANTTFNQTVDEDPYASADGILLPTRSIIDADYDSASITATKDKSSTVAIAGNRLTVDRHQSLLEKVIARLSGRLLTLAKVT